MSNPFFEHPLLDSP
ncbi:fragment of hypothetical protein, partial [Aromatoleum aromaticum EbN1]